MHKDLHSIPTIADPCFSQAAASQCHPVAVWNTMLILHGQFTCMKVSAATHTANLCYVMAHCSQQSLPL